MLIEKDLYSSKVSHKMGENSKMDASVKKFRTSIYLDTSVPSAYYDGEKPERQELTKEFWQKIKDYEVYVSELVKQELNQIGDETLKGKMLKLIGDFKALKSTDEVKKLTDKYIEEGVVPEKFESDVLHIAIATANGVDFLISWNFKHLVNVKTKRMVNLINVKNGYKEIEVIAPPEF